MRRRSMGDDGKDAEQPPAQRRKLVEANFGQPDVILVSEDGVEYDAHQAVLKISCGNFSSLLAETVKAEDQDDTLPRVSIPASSETIENILPAAYRRPTAHLRSKPYGDLAAAMELAHKLDLSAAVEVLAIYLEKHADGPDAVKLYLMAHKLGLEGLKTMSEPAMLATVDLSDYYQHAAVLDAGSRLFLHRQRLIGVFEFYMANRRAINSVRQLVKQECQTPGHAPLHRLLVSKMLDLLCIVSISTTALSSPSLKSKEDLLRSRTLMQDMLKILRAKIGDRPGHQQDCSFCKATAELVESIEDGYRKLFPASLDQEDPGEGSP